MKGKGFTLIEMLVSIVIFVIVMLGVYTFFDQGLWFYQAAEKRANIQDMGRIAIEQMERDFRMIGSGVPYGGQITAGTSVWTPFLFQANTSDIGFRGDMDARNSMLRTSASANPVSVHDADRLCSRDGASLPIAIVIADERRRWQPVNCTAYNGAADTITISATVACTASECEATTPEHVWYRLDGDADGDGICDATTVTDYPFCTLERAEQFGNTPITTPTVGYEEVATNIVNLQFEYFELDGSASASNVVAQRIRITMVVRDKSSTRPGQFQDFNLGTEVVLRDQRY